MQSFLVDLIIGIIGGIYSSVIVSRIFLIREEYHEQLEILRNSIFHLAGVNVFFEVIEIILKNRNDTYIEISKNPEYIKSANLIEAKPLIEKLKKEVFEKNVSKILLNDTSFVLKEKELIMLQRDISMVVRKIKKFDVEKFDDIDKCKQEIETLEAKYKCYVKKKNKVFFKLIIKDKIITILFSVFVVIALYTICAIL